VLHRAVEISRVAGFQVDRFVKLAPDTFGTSGFPFTLPNARRQWDYSGSLCPVAELACRETFCIWWNEGLRPEHVEEIGTAIEKVVQAYSTVRA
jgi:hypothetical protein